MALRGCDRRCVTNLYNIPFDIGWGMTYYSMVGSNHASGINIEAHMQTKPKANSVVTHAIVDGKIVFTVKDAGTFTFDPNKASATNRARAIVHGFIQRIADGAAISRNPDNGQPATAADKMARMQRIADHYESGAEEWAMRAATGPRKPDAGLIVLAMTRTVAKGDADRANALIDGIATKRGIDRDAALAVWASVEDVAAEATTSPPATSDRIVGMGDRPYHSGHSPMATSPDTTTTTTTTIIHSTPFHFPGNIP
jgi:hypothetical protein